MDVLLGRTKPFITKSVLSTYDAYTVSFGDNGRYYMRGQLTIFRNNNQMNNLWRKCKDLAHIATRLKAFSDHHDETKRMKGWRFESAEGCISKVVADERGIRSIATTNLLSDAFKAPVVEKETIMLNSVALRCYGMPLNEAPASEMASVMSDNWYGSRMQWRFKCVYFLSMCREYRESDESSGKLMTTDSTRNCAFWIPKPYQVRGYTVAVATKLAFLNEFNVCALGGLGVCPSLCWQD